MLNTWTSAGSVLALGSLVRILLAVVGHDRSAHSDPLLLILFALVSLVHLMIVFWGAWRIRRLHPRLALLFGFEALLLVCLDAEPLLLLSAVVSSLAAGFANSGPVLSATSIFALPVMLFGLVLPPAPMIYLAVMLALVSLASGVAHEDRPRHQRPPAPDRRRRALPRSDAVGRRRAAVQSDAR
jgi:hypothetical protein